MAIDEGYQGPTFEFDNERFPFEPMELMGSDVKLLKSRTGLTFMKYVNELQDGLGAEALGFYVWLTLTRAGKEPGKYSEFDYSYSSLLASLEGFGEDGSTADATPDPTPTRRTKRASSRTSEGGGRSSRTTAEESPPTGS